MIKDTKEFLIRKAIRCLLESHGYSMKKSLEILEGLLETARQTIDGSGGYGE